MSLNLILGRSARAAISTLERCQAANTLCVVSPSPRAERRMSDEDLILTFTYMGECLKRMVRMETHFYSSNSLWLPAKALTAFLRKATKLEDFLLNGVRIKGTDQDIVQLGMALLEHPKLKKVTFFNIAPHRQPNKSIGSEVDLLPIVEGVSRNANIRNMELRYAGWANHHLGTLVSPRFSQLTYLSMSGIDTLYGPEGDGIHQGFHDLMDGLKTNVRLQELKISQSPGPVGTGALVAEMLRENNHLQKLTIHFASVTDCLPIANVLEHDNHTLTHVETRLQDLPPLPTMTRRSDDEDDELAREQRNKVEIRAREIEAVQNAYETALITNGSLVSVRLFSRSRDHSTPNITFYTRMNVAGRMEILLDEELLAEEAIEFLESNSEDTSIAFYMLRARVDMIPLMVNYCTERARKIKKGIAPFRRPSARNTASGYESSSDSDDDLPIKFLASKARSSSSSKRKRPTTRRGNSTIQARPARTLKRRRRA